jgi:hypothetical protein
MERIDELPDNWNEHFRTHDRRGKRMGVAHWQTAADLLNDSARGREDIEAAKVHAQLAAIAFAHPFELSEGVDRLASDTSSLPPHVEAGAV